MGDTPAPAEEYDVFCCVAERPPREGAGPLPAHLLDRGQLPLQLTPTSAWAAEEGGETLLTCPVADQAALYGLLRKVRDLGLPLMSVTRAQTDQIDGPDFKQPIEASTSERKQVGGN